MTPPPRTPQRKASSPSPTVAAAKFKKLPNPCEAFSKDTVKKLLPKAKDASGRAGQVHRQRRARHLLLEQLGRQGRRRHPVPLAGHRLPALRLRAGPSATGEKRATDFYGKQVSDAKTTKGAKKVEDGRRPSGTGDEATAVTYDLKKDGNDFKNTTVVARTSNIVVTLNYNGAGLAGGDTPKADDLLKKAQAAAKEAVAAAAKANS